MCDLDGSSEIRLLDLSSFFTSLTSRSCRMCPCYYEENGGQGYFRKEERVNTAKRETEKEERQRMWGSGRKARRGQTVINQFQWLSARQAVFGHAGSQEHAHRRARCHCGIWNITRATVRSLQSAVGRFDSIDMVCLSLSLPCSINSSPAISIDIVT